MYNANMKVGIYGGTFDPIHNGHIIVANAVKHELELDRVIFVVTADPPHKHNADRTSGLHRFNMVEAAIKSESGLEASDIELKRGGISFTVDTLRDFSLQYEDAKLFFIVGADMLFDFSSWYRPDEILKFATLVGVGRDGKTFVKENGKLHRACVDYEKLRETADQIENDFGGEVIVLGASGPDISSTDVRTKVHDALPITDCVPVETDHYIYENLLYVDSELQNIGRRLSEVLSEHRYKHSLYTAREAVLLANRYGVDAKKARLAALMHDCVKFDDAKLIKYAFENGYELSDEEIENPFLIHSRLGAIAAKNDYGIDDPEIINAIERHTLGSENMTALDKIIYLADKIEPSRDHKKIQEMRKLSYIDLDKAVIAVMENSINYAESCGKKVHPLTKKAMDAIKMTGN